MTCIVGIEHDGVVYIGGDSLAIAGDALETREDEKVFLTDDEKFLIGFSGSYRIGQLLHYAFTPPEQMPSKSDMCYMVTDFINAVRTLQSEHGTVKKENEVEQHDGPFLVAYKGKLYSIDTDFQVALAKEPYTAIGIGAQVALGAMYAMKDSKLDPEEKIKRALRAAEEFSSGVRGPFLVLKLEPEEEEEQE